MRRVWSISTWCDLETQIIVSADRMRTFPGALLIPQAASRTLTFVRNLLGLGQGHLNRKLHRVFYCPGASMMSRRAALASFFGCPSVFLPLHFRPCWTFRIGSHAGEGRERVVLW